MASQPRSRRTQPDSDALNLLSELLESTPAPHRTRPAPISLRSIERERDHTLRGFLRRTWVDFVLKYAERALIFAALLVFGMWFTDGPLRDWLHQQQPASAAQRAPRIADSPEAAPQSVPNGRVAALLPYTSPEMSIPNDDGFLSPRQAAPSGPVVQTRDPHRLVVPKLNLDTPIKRVFVVDGVWEVADYAAGFMNGTALPGDAGNTVLAGHAGLRGAVFRDLGQLALGDELFLDAGDWRFHYRVREITSVWPNQVEVLDSHGRAELTLMTCTNWDTQRLVVVADLLDSKPSSGA